MEKLIDFAMDVVDMAEECCDPDKPYQAAIACHILYWADSMDSVLLLYCKYQLSVVD